MLEPQNENKKPKEATSSKSSKIYGGFIVGCILGGIMLSIHVLGLSPSEFYNTSKIKLLLVPLGFGGIGAIFGEKIIDRLAELLRWY